MASTATTRFAPDERRRRAHLERQVDGAALVRALPLWVGTLRDIDDLLPAKPGLFDLVILDEASQIDQIRRPRPRCCGPIGPSSSGDPYQLRHVTFLSDEQVTYRPRPVTK